MTNTSSFDIDAHWDAIIVGTGIGGATLGYALAKAGKKVLFCEKGRSYLDTTDALQGQYAETYFDRPAVPQAQHQTVLSRAGRYTELIDDTTLSRQRSFIPFIGSGTGGSSALYGMALERFFPSDFEPGRHHPQALDSTIPQEWPIGYETLAPYYTAAERLYRVHGGADPLRHEAIPEHFLAPPPLTAGSQELFDFLTQQGQHPYRLPLACEFVEGCECCQGYLCAKNCKNDSARICLQPAITQYGAKLLSECSVTSLEATRQHITAVVCNWRGQTIRLQGDTVILAAGALQTPALLQRSASAHWPRGLANDSGLVGTNLMRHHIDLYLIQPRTQLPVDNRQKEIAFNDLYHSDGQKLGSVQSFGRLPPPELLAESLQQDIRDSSLPWAANAFKLVKPLMKPILGGLVNRSLVLATIMEDLPYADNRIESAPADADTGRITLHYRVHRYDQDRTQVFRHRMMKLLSPYRPKLIAQAENNQRIAHACGTCRFGRNPTDSVLDPNNRAHGINNLYIVDSSFFPSSGGTNPSLTIAANALRVADHIVHEQNVGSTLMVKPSKEI